MVIVWKTCKNGNLLKLISTCQNLIYSAVKYRNFNCNPSNSTIYVSRYRALFSFVYFSFLWFLVDLFKIAIDNFCAN